MGRLSLCLLWLRPVRREAFPYSESQGIPLRLTEVSGQAKLSDQSKGSRQGALRLSQGSWCHRSRAVRGLGLGPIRIGMVRGGRPALLAKRRSASGMREGRPHRPARPPYPVVSPKIPSLRPLVVSGPGGVHGARPGCPCPP